MPRIRLLPIALLGLALGCLPTLSLPPSASADDISSIAQNLSAPDAQTRIEAADKLARRGMSAAPAVPSLIKALSDSNADVRWHAARAISAIGPEASEAVPELTELLEDPDAHVRAHAASALGMFGQASKSAVPQLAKAVTDADPTVRREAVQALRAIRPGPDVILPILTRLLGDSDPSVVLRAIDAISEVGKPAVPALIQAVDNPRMRFWAVLVLNNLGPDAAEAIPSLLRALEEDPKPELRMEILLTLGNIGSAAQSAGPQIEKYLRDPMPTVHRAAIFALAQIGYEPAIESIAPFTESSDEMTRIVSLWSLAKLDPSDENVKEAVLAAISSLKSQDEHVRRAAAHAIYDLHAPPEVVAPALVEALDHSSPEVISAVAQALASCGAEAVPRVIPALENDQLRHLAVAVLSAMGPEAAEAVPALTNQLEQADDPELQREIQLALAGIGPAAADAVPQLIESLQSDELLVRSSAAYALGRVGPAASSAVDPLRDRFENDDEKFVRMASIWALIHIRPNDEGLAKLAVPLLIEALKSERSEVRYEAVTTLGELGPAAVDAISSIEPLVHDLNEAVRNAATLALTRLQAAQ